MTDAARISVRPNEPATFASRGVAMPFTTPMLAGARARASGRAGIELVMPNPSGARGFYVLPWPGVRTLCRPTVFDTLLVRLLAGSQAIDPATVRAAALDIAAQGYAGPAAAAAASTAMAHDNAQRARTYFMLLTTLLVRLDPDGLAGGASPERIIELEQRAGHILRRIAPLLGRPADHLARALAAIGDLATPAGIATGGRDARIPRLLAGLDKAHADLSVWLDADPANDIGGLGRAIAIAMRLACDNAETVLAATRAALADPVTLLKRWIADADAVRTLVTRCEWLLDGWERVVSLWRSADPRAARRPILLEMAPLVPVLPPEVMTWTGTPLPPEAMEPACRVTSREDGWRTGGAAFALIARNEALLVTGA
ncbi:MAG TPA: hypothetical protein VFG12_04040 [Rhodopila sp.]|nr:hypothetical protein [Rhodopila sp.]